MSEFEDFEKNLKEFTRNKDERFNTGFIIVWDLDNTLVGEYSDQRRFDSEEIVLNPRAVELLRRCIEARDKGIVSAIFLLTNNADDFFIKVVELTLSMRVKKNYHYNIFDYIMSRNHPFRSPPLEDPPKSLREVEYMMVQEKLPLENLSNRVFFIDDNPSHAIGKEIPREHYIQITPPFLRGVVDTTNFSVLETALEIRRGGKRKSTRKKSYFRVQKKRSIKTRKH